MKYAASCCAVALAASAALFRAAPLLDAQSAPPKTPSSAGEFVVDPPTLINLGFEWLVEGDANRSRVGRGVLSEDRRDRVAPGAAAAAAERRAHQATGSTIDVTVPNMFAGSILDLEPDTSYEAQFVLTDPDGVRGEATSSSRCGRAPSRCRRPTAASFHVYPHGFKGAEDRAGVRRPDVRLQPHVLRHRLVDGRPAARQAGRHHPGSRRALQIQPLRVHQQRRR